MATNDEETRKKLGLQKNGSLVVDAENDYCVRFMKSLDWDRPLQRTPADRPYIDPESLASRSYAFKYLRYETEDGYYDPDNPFLGENITNLRSAENRDNTNKRKREKAKAEENFGGGATPDFTFETQEVRNVDKTNQGDNDEEEEEDDFLDEYGNIKEKQDDDDNNGGIEGDASDTSEAEGKKSNKLKRRGGEGASKKPNITDGDIPGVFKSPQNPSAGGSEKTDGQHWQRSPPPSFTRPLVNQSYKRPWKDFDAVRDLPSAMTSPVMDADSEDATTKKKPILFKQVQLQEPRESHLSRKEQEMYVHLLYKFVKAKNANAAIAQDGQGFQVFQSFRDVVLAEQKEYQDFAKSNYVGKTANTFLLPEARRYTEDKLAASFDRVRSYPRLYLPALRGDSVIRLVPMSNEQTEAKPQFELRVTNTLLELGQILKIMIPTVKKMGNYENPYRVPQLYDKVASKYPIVKENRCEVSKDSNAKKLAKIVKPEVVITINAIKVIVNNFGSQFEEEWQLPITAEKIDDKIVLFVDSPLPRTNALSAHDKNVFFHRKSTKVFLLHPWSRPCKARPRHESNEDDGLPVPVAADDPFEEESGRDLDLSVLETFGTTTRFAQLDGNHDTESSDDDDGELQMVIDTEDEGKMSSPAAPTSKTSASSLPTRRTTRSQAKYSSDELTSPPSKTASMGKRRGRPPKNATPQPVQSEAASKRNSTSTTSKGEGGDAPTKVLNKKLRLLEGYTDSDKQLTSQLKENSQEEENDLISVLKEDRSIHSATDSSQLEVDEDEDVIRSPKIKRRSKMAIESDDDEQEVKPKQVKKTRKERSKNNSLDTNDLLGNIMAGQKSMLENPVQIAKEAQQRQDQGQERWEYRGENVAVAAAGLGEAKDYEQPLEGKNLNYRQWSLWPKSANHGQPLSLIVRGSTHGISVHNHETQAFTISTKLETQVAFGADSLTRKELANDWMATLLRPNSQLVRMRVDGRNSAVLATERKTLKELTSDGLEVGFKPAEDLGNLYTLLGDLVNNIREEGQYLLKHDATSGAFVRVMKAVETTPNKDEDLSRPFDLHMLYNNVRPNQDGNYWPVWRPLDVNLITPFHYREGRVPCLFAPKENMNYNGGGNHFQGGGAGRGRGRGNRGRGRGRGRGFGRGGRPRGRGRRGNLT